MPDENETIHKIALEVGSPVTADEVRILWDIGAMIRDYGDQPPSPFDYSDFQSETDYNDDLPVDLTPSMSKRGRPERPERKFLRSFFNVVEYVRSEPVTWREGAKHRNLSDKEKIEAFNQSGKVAFLIAREFFPGITIDGATGNPNDTGDVVALLRPKKDQRPFNVTGFHLKEEARKDEHLEQTLAQITEDLDTAQVIALVKKFPNELGEFRRLMIKKKML